VLMCHLNSLKHHARETKDGSGPRSGPSLGLVPDREVVVLPGLYAMVSPSPLSSLSFKVIDWQLL